jgi:hypothetical protein
MMNKIIGVVAPKGSGKTTRVAELVRTTPRVAVYDPMAATDFQYRMAASEIIERDLDAFHQQIAEENFQVLYEPELPVQDGEEWYYPDFRPFIQKVWRRVQLIGPMMVVIDEAHYTMSKRTMPVEVLNIITNGRRYGLDIVWSTQRFVGVNGWARANADEYWFFRLAHPADIHTVSEIAGPEVAEQVSQLRRLDTNVQPVVPGEMLIWSSLDGSSRIEDLNARGSRTRKNDRGASEPKIPQARQEADVQPPSGQQNVSREPERSGG